MSMTTITLAQNAACMAQSAENERMWMLRELHRIPVKHSHEVAAWAREVERRILERQKQAVINRGLPHPQTEGS